jgi:hypothetical protein
MTIKRTTILCKNAFYTDPLGAMLFPKFLRKKYSLKRRNRYGIEES